MGNLIIRKEKKEDYWNTEHMVMRAFWNIHGPGCNEHLVVHKLREAEEYVPALSRVAELDGRIIGTIMYSKAVILCGNREEQVLTFGPLCVEPTAQHLKVGEKLLKETLPLAKEAGYPCVCIFGEPDYYPRHGFVTCDRYGITDQNGNNFDAFLMYVLEEGKLSGIKGKFREAEVFETCEDEAELAQFNQNFPKYQPLKLSCQWLHKERLGRIRQAGKENYTIQFWEMEIPAALADDFDLESGIPQEGDYVTFDYKPDGRSTILMLCDRKEWEGQISE